MSDDTIRAALEAAVNDYDAARVRSHNGDIARDGMSDANKAHIRPLIAAAIASFLRALHESHPDDAWIAAELAAAVEEAARHE